MDVYLKNCLKYHTETLRAANSDLLEQVLFNMSPIGINDFLHVMPECTDGSDDLHRVQVGHCAADSTLRESTFL